MTDTLTAPAVQLDETEAAQLEGLAPMPQDLISKRQERLALKEQRDAIQARMDEIRDEFGARLEAEGLQGFVLNGKVHARRSVVQTRRVDSKKLKEKHPQIWRAFSILTESVRIVVD